MVSSFAERSRALVYTDVTLRFIGLSAAGASCQEPGVISLSSEGDAGFVLIFCAAFLTLHHSDSVKTFIAHKRYFPAAFSRERGKELWKPQSCKYHGAFNDTRQSKAVMVSCHWASLTAFTAIISICYSHYLTGILYPQHTV